MRQPFRQLARQISVLLIALATTLAPLAPCADDAHGTSPGAAGVDVCSHAGTGSMAASEEPSGNGAPADAHPCVCVCHFPVVSSQVATQRAPLLVETAAGFEGCRPPDDLPRAIFQPPRLLA